ncbi:replicative DNA helicase [Patescibacteria group bacterium]|nr:replicative DNA helicase [Patescibacteria group bacterium]MBU1922572.1 replicative DNA helicase [Patescibacteria group bacterium]
MPTDAILNKVPPQNLEAEVSLLGSLMLDKDAMIRVADMVVTDDFYKDTHAKIFQTMLDLYSKREPIDILTMGNRLEENKQLEAVGGRSFLMELSNTVPTAAHVVHYAQIIQKKATLRRLIAAASDIVNLGFDEAEDIEALLDKAEQKLFGVSQKYLKQTFVPIKDILSEAFERIDELHREKGKLRGISTGFPELDNLLAGLQKSDLIVLAARPSVGKTSLALDMARHIGTRLKIPIGLFSLEMSKEQLVDRLICAEAGVDLWKMRTGKLSEREGDDDFPRIGHALGILSEAPIFIDDSAMVNIMEIRTKARRLQIEHNLGLIIVDYLQLMESRSRSENRVQEVAEITRALKGIARELNVPVIAISQLSRAVEMAKPAIPRLSHLRESGSIEQDADVVMFIYRKAVDKNYQIDDIPPEERHIAEIHIAKHRNGPTGIVRLYFDEQRTTFRSLERTYREETPPQQAPTSSEPKKEAAAQPGQPADKDPF